MAAESPSVEERGAISIGDRVVTFAELVEMLGEVLLSVGYLAFGMGLGVAMFTSKAINQVCPPVLRAQSECATGLWALARQDARLLVIGGGVALVLAYGAPAVTGLLEERMDERNAVRQEVSDD